MLRNVITLGLQRISSQVLNVIIALDKIVNVHTSINVILRRFRLKHWCRAKARGITYSECMSADLVIQHANCIRLFCYLSSSVASLALRPYLTYGTIFEKLLRIQRCFDFLYNFV
jgi:hypothetical protein